MTRSTPLRICAFAALCVSAALAHARQFPATRPYKAVIHQYIEQSDPPQRIHAVSIDLTNRDVKLRVAPGGPDPDGDGKWQTTLQRPTAIAEREGFEVAINGDFFAATRARDAPKEQMPKEQKGYVVDMWATVTGPATTDGRTWSRLPKGQERPSLLIDGKNRAVIAEVGVPPSDARQVVSGSDILVHNGKDIAPTSEGFAMTRHPRTAVGIADGGKRLVLVVVDGRRKDAAGMTLPELAAVMVQLGCASALNLDGGGSSAIVLEDPKTGEQRIVNASAGRERPVANVLGVDVRPENKSDPR